MELSKVLDGFVDADTLIIKAQVQVIRFIMRSIFINRVIQFWNQPNMIVDDMPHLLNLLYELLGCQELLKCYCLVLLICFPRSVICL